ncbi:MAG TPA: outer membrane beta-barrel protein [Vicinamibacterales bacterium]|nr:outer membrane beta-barrel protein [Vicinamibacterales bacterium]
MRSLGLIVAAAVAACCVSAPAQAQDRKVQVNIGGGYTATTGKVHDHLGDGGNFMIGVTFNANEHLGIQAEYGYTPVGSKEVDVPYVQPLSGSAQVSAGHHMHQGTFNLIGKFGAADAKARPYGVVGVGVYDRVVQLTSPGTGLVTVCDPWWYICYPVAVPVTNILGERSSTDFGMNFGGGVNVKLAEHVAFYTEARFHYIWGPKASSFIQGTPPAGFVDSNANGQYFQITFGLRF